MEESVTLSEQWDHNSAILPTKITRTPYFTGRKRIVQLIANEIVRRKQGSILISGRRGAGKTEIVHAAMAEAHTLTPSNQYLFVRVNASQFEETDSHGDLGDTSKPTSTVTARKIIQSLIRALFAAICTTTNSKKEEVRELYEKAIASDWARHQDSSQSTHEATQTTRQAKFQFSIGPQIVPAVLTVAGTASGAIVIAQLISNTHPIIGAIITVIYILGMFAGGMYTVERVKKVEKGNESSIGSKLLCKFDNSNANLEHDLETIQREISASHQIIYVVDELDKLDAEVVKRALAHLKLLITNSCATFIFITESDLFDKACENREGINARPVEYTLFSSKFYVEPARSKELEEYLDSIVVQKSCTESHWKLLKKSLIFASKNDFFDLKQEVQNRIVEFDERHRPVLNCDLNADDPKDAYFQQAIRILLEGRYLSESPLGWRDNEKLWKCAYDFVKKNLSREIGFQFPEPSGKEAEEQLRRDIAEIFYRSGHLEKGSSQSDVYHNNPIRTWRIREGMEMPPDTLASPTEYEGLYIGDVDLFTSYAIAIFKAGARYRGDAIVEDGKPLAIDETFWNQIGSCGFDFRGIIDKHQPEVLRIRNSIKQTPRNRDEIQRLHSEITQGLRSLQGSMPSISARVLMNEFPHLTLKVENLASNASLFTDEAQPIRSAIGNNGYPVLFDSSRSHQVLLLSDNLVNLQRIQKELSRVKHSHRVLFCSPKSEDNSRLPETVRLVDTSLPERLEQTLCEALSEMYLFFTSNDGQN